MAKTPQAHDKPGHRSHHAQDTGKHDVFDGPRVKRCKTRVLEAPKWNWAAGALHLWRAGKTTISHLKMMFYEAFGYFCRRSVGAGA